LRTLKRGEQKVGEDWKEHFYMKEPKPPTVWGGFSHRVISLADAGKSQITGGKEEGRARDGGGLDG